MSKPAKISVAARVTHENADAALDLDSMDGIDRDDVLARLHESQTRLNLIADSVPALIAYIDQEHNYLYANKAFEHWFDCDVDKLLGRNVRELVGDEAYTVIKEYADRALAGETAAYETWMPYANGRRYVSASFKPHVVEADDVRGVFALVHDLTDRKIIEDELSKEREFSEAVLNSLDDELCIIDGTGNILFANKSWYDFGRANEALVKNDTWIGVNYFSACASESDVDDERPHQIVDGIKKVLRREKSRFQSEYPCHSPMEDRWFRITVTPLSEATTTTEQKAVILHTNITDRYLAEAATREVNAELGKSIVALQRTQEVLQDQAVKLRTSAEKEILLNEKLRHEIDVKNRFFSVLAHDLKSPFTALLGGAKSLSERAPSMDGDMVGMYARNIHRSCSRVFNLLEQLLEWGRYQVIDQPLSPEDLNVRPLLEDVVAVTLDQASVKDITVKLHVTEDQVVADSNALSTVMRNLLANSVKFSHPGGEVLIAADAMEDGRVCLSVKDDGVGISDTVLCELFNLDSKTSTTGTAGERGTGLGLPLCHDLIEKSGGSIEVKSQVGIGTTFSVYLPKPDLA